MHNDVSAIEMSKSSEVVSDTSSSLRSGFDVPINNVPSTTTSNNDVKTSTNTTDTQVEYYDDVPEGYTEYFAKNGETLEDIANANNMTVEELKSVNTDLMDDNIDKGVRLFVPLNNDIIDDGETKNIVDKDTYKVEESSTHQYKATNDLRNLNLGDFSSMRSSFLSKIDGVLSKLRLLFGSFSKVYNFATEKGYDLSNAKDIDAAIDSFIKDNQEYKDVDIDRLKTMIKNNNTVKSNSEPESINSNNSNNNEVIEYYESIIKSILVQIGYKESELEEYSVFDILDAFQSNKDIIEQLLKDKLGLTDYDINQILYSYVFNHYKGLIPT
jgi:LysM repeat protein